MTIRSSEAQFKTLKYHPGFPGRFLGIEPAIGHCRNVLPVVQHTSTAMPAASPC